MRETLDGFAIRETIRSSMEITSHPRPASLAFKPRAFSGWSLEIICDLDGCCPNFLGHVLQANDAKRQAVFAAVAKIKSGGTDLLAEALGARTEIDLDDPFDRIARALIVLKPREILRAVFGSVPDGLQGTLARLGPDPLRRPSLYRDLFDLFARPEHRNRAKLLRQTPGKLSEARVDIALRLHPSFLHQPLFDAIKLREEVDQLHSALDLIRATVSTATDQNLRDAIRNIGPNADLKSWIEGWLRKQDRFLAPPPIQNDPDLVLVTGSALADAGKRFRNCLGQKLVNTAVGRNAYYEWAREPGGAVELSRLSDGRWLATEVRGHRNRTLDRETATAIWKKLQQHGVLTYSWPFPAPATRAAATILHAFDLTTDWTGIEGLTDDLECAGFEAGDDVRGEAA